MAVALRSLEVALPSTVLHQQEAREVFAGQPQLSRLSSRLVGAAFGASGIDTRYTCIDEFSLDHPSADPVFFDAETRSILSPSTAVRNSIYERESSPLYIEAARRALEAAQGISAADVTHVITVSCTGFFNPGPDFKVVRGLGLCPSVERYHLGFMGCYASFPALRAAKQFCDADPNAVVLVVSVELCTLHTRTTDNQDAILGCSLFADGAGAAIITGRDLPPSGPYLSLDHFETTLTPIGEESMAWNIGDSGFEMILGNEVPRIIDEYLVGALEPLLASDPSLDELPYADIEHWAIHPGGRSILDKVEAKLELSEKQLVPSRDTLRNYGNMSSATILFVLQHILRLPAPGGEERICAMAFGPGLTVETALLTKVTPD